MGAQLMLASLVAGLIILTVALAHAHIGSGAAATRAAVIRFLLLAAGATYIAVVARTTADLMRAILLQRPR
ncbi:MAG: hypothetical protein NUW23_08665 [Firmicutes bacterium]|jgi:hypothetical protein|nr:hypothetical protein [Bacillota bacterium]